MSHIETKYIMLTKRRGQTTLLAFVEEKTLSTLFS
jgi:hypothetical protein